LHIFWNKVHSGLKAKGLKMKYWRDLVWRLRKQIKSLKRNRRSEIDHYKFLVAQARERENIANHKYNELAIAIRDACRHSVVNKPEILKSQNPLYKMRIKRAMDSMTAPFNPNKSLVPKFVELDDHIENMFLVRFALENDLLQKEIHFICYVDNPTIGFHRQFFYAVSRSALQNSEKWLKIFFEREISSSFIKFILNGIDK